MMANDDDGGRASRRPAMRRAAVAVSLAGPVGVVVALLAGWPVLPITAICAAAAGLAAALTSSEDSAGDAAVLAILPIGAWLIGAAVGWGILAVVADSYPVLDRYAFVATLLAAALFGALSVAVVVFNFRRPSAP